MKRITCSLLAGLALVLFSGCGGDSKDKSDNSNSEKKEDQRTTGSSQAANPEGGASRGANGDIAGRVRVDGYFSAGSDLNDKNKLKNLALGIHNFHDVMRKFPMAAADGKNISDQLSWRVLIMPYVELNTDYEAFDKAQAWDSAKNKPLVDGKGREAFTLSNGNLVCAIRHTKEQAKSFRNILDGASNTIMMMENPNASGDEWTQPKDLTEKEAVKIVKSLKKGEFLLAAFYDGSVCKIYSPEGKSLKDADVEGIFGYSDLTETNPIIFQPAQ